MSLWNAFTENLKFIYVIWLLIWSLVLFFMMGRDKRLSKLRRRRVPEATLFFLACLGGALGGCIGMQLFRHKTQHPKFSVGFPLIMLVQWALVILLVFADPAAAG